MSSMTSDSSNSGSGSSTASGFSATEDARNTLELLKPYSMEGELVIDGALVDPVYRLLITEIGPYIDNRPGNDTPDINKVTLGRSMYEMILDRRKQARSSALFRFGCRAEDDRHACEISWYALPVEVKEKFVTRLFEFTKKLAEGGYRFSRRRPSKLRQQSGGVQNQWEKQNAGS